MESLGFCSFSGGKDSCLALYRAIKQGYDIKYLLTMFQENGERSRSHGIKPEFFEAYSESLKMKHILAKATWNDYEEIFKKEISNLSQKGVQFGVFGDIDIDSHREWVVNACSHTHIKVLHPLWNEKRIKLIHEFIDLGFKAKIVTLNTDYLNEKYLGQEFTKKLITEFKKLGIDACGENGEFHTIVYDGPIFHNPISFTCKEVININQYRMLDLHLIN